MRIAAVLALIFWMALAVAAAPPPVYRDPYAGFSIARPAGWKLDYQDGTIVLTRDVAGLVGVMVFPAKLQSDMSAEAFVTAFAAAIGNVIREAGGTFELTQRAARGSTARALALATVDGVPLKAPLWVEKEPGFVTLRLYFAPATRFAREEPVLKTVARSFRRNTLVGDGRVGAPTRKQRAEPSVPMRLHQGRWFRTLLPAGWKIAAETDRGIDVMAPDGSASVSFAYATSGTGGGTATGVIQAFLPQVAPGARVLKTQALPPVAAGWDTAAVEYEATVQGRRVHGVMTATSGMTGFMSGVRVADTRSWAAKKLLLGRIQESMQITSTDGPSSQGVMLPRNNPLDSSSIMSSWEYKNRVQDRASQQWSNATLGVDQVQSPTTGQQWTVPQNAWWGTGPYGAGYYRGLPNGQVEKMTIMNP